MANSAANNITSAYNPTSWNGGIGTKVTQVVDPFNLTNWNQKPTVDSAGEQPLLPGYSQEYDPSSMSLTDYLAGHYDHSGFDAFSEQALRKGPSAWASLAKQDQGLQAAKARDKGASQANAQTAQAEDELAARGGLSSGARERATQEGAKNYLSMAQETGRQENLNNMQIGMNDEQNRIQQLSALPGMEQSQAQMWEQARQGDINNTVQENDRRNQWNQNLYNQKMSAWSAAKQADATENSGKK